MKKEMAITVKDLHISYRGLKKFSIKRSLFKGKKNSKEIISRKSIPSNIIIKLSKVTQRILKTAR